MIQELVDLIINSAYIIGKIVIILFAIGCLLAIILVIYALCLAASESDKRSEELVSELIEREEDESEYVSDAYATTYTDHSKMSDLSDDQTTGHNFDTKS